MINLTKIPTKTLNDGNQIPVLGFGTYKLNGAQGVNAINSALSNGYTLLDSAFNYENEGTVGKAIRRSSIKREDIFVTSKLPGRHQTYDQAIPTIQESLYRAGLDYYDLYLIHWPNPKEDHYVEAWQALIDAQKFGLVRSIGVCNFLPEHLERLVAETGVTPAVNQIELHPYWSQASQRAYDQAHRIFTQAWSPLGRASSVLQEPGINAIADKHHKSAAQVILRWEFQLGVGIIPKANSTSHQLANLDIFDFKLTPEELAAITELDKPNGRLKNQDPTVYQEF